MLELGDQVEFSQTEMDALVQSDILSLHVQDMQLTAQKAAGSVPELIEVKSSSGYELKVHKVEGGTWHMEVTKEPNPS